MTLAQITQTGSEHVCKQNNGGEPLTLADGTTAYGIMTLQDAEPPNMTQEGTVNPNAPESYKFVTQTPIPVGYRAATDARGVAYDCEDSMEQYESGEIVYYTCWLLKREGQRA
jgi:hypothetical protein